MDLVDEFWAAFLRSRPAGLDAAVTYAEAFRFGNTDEMADELAELVLAGIKTTTSELWWSVQARPEPPIRPGDHSVVLNAAGAPVCVIQTLRTEVMAFNEVDERFATDYGEGDRTLGWWRTHLWDYYAAECRRHGWPPHPEMPLLCETFQVVYPRADG